MFSLAGWLLLYFILRTQTLWNFTGLNPLHFHSAPWNVTFNTTSSFLTNTNWQYYGGETTLSYFSQMPGLTVQNFLSAGGRDRRRGRADPRHRRPQRQEPGQLLAGPGPHDPVRAAADLVRRRDRAGLPGRRSRTSRLPARVTADQRRLRRRSRWARSPRRRRSRCSAPTAAASSTSTPRTRSRTRPGSRTSFEMLLVLMIPAALVFTYGRMAGNRRQGYAIYSTMMVMFLGAVIVGYIAEAHGSPGAARRRPAHRRDPRLRRRQPGGQGAAVRDRRLGAVRRRHDRHLVRRGQQRASSRSPASAARSRSRTCRPVRGDLRRRRHRPVLDPALRPAGGVHRRPDGRPHARVPRQEDRGAGDQAGRARAADHAAGGAVLDRAGDRRQPPGARRSPSVGGRARRASPRPSTPT